MTANIQTTLAKPARKPRKGFFRILFAAHDIWVERRALRDLDAHILKDLGLEKEAVDREANRRIWDAPERWLR